MAWSTCIFSSRAMNWFESDKPGIDTRVFSQKIAQNEPLNRIPLDARERHEPFGK